MVSANTRRLFSVLLLAIGLGYVMPAVSCATDAAGNECNQQGQARYRIAPGTDIVIYQGGVARLYRLISESSDTYVLVDGGMKENPLYAGCPRDIEGRTLTVRNKGKDHTIGCFQLLEKR